MPRVTSTVARVTSSILQEASSMPLETSTIGQETSLNSKMINHNSLKDNQLPEKSKIFQYPAVLWHGICNKQDRIPP